MKEVVHTVTPGDHWTDRACIHCHDGFSVGDEAVSCPRCRQPHHRECWVKRGGCATMGCRQVVHKSLLPAKDEQPIRTAPISPWAVIAGIAVVFLLVFGLYSTMKKAQERRGSTLAIMIPSLEPESVWRQVVDHYNSDPDRKKPMELFVTPYGPAGTAYEQKLFVVMAAGESPEIVLLEEERYFAYAEREAFLPLDDIVPALVHRGIDVSHVDFTSLRFEGALFGLPHPRGDGVIAAARPSASPEDGKSALVDIYAQLYSIYDNAL